MKGMDAQPNCCSGRSFLAPESSTVGATFCQQLISEVHGHNRQRESEAGRSKIAGSVLSSEKCIIVVRKDKSRNRDKSRRIEGCRKAEDLDALWRVCKSPPGSETRAGYQIMSMTVSLALYMTW